MKRTVAWLHNLRRLRTGVERHAELLLAFMRLGDRLPAHAELAVKLVPELELGGAHAPVLIGDRPPPLSRHGLSG